MANLLPSTAIMFGAFLGALLFYIFEFTSKKSAKDFSLLVWAKLNWWKILVLSPLCLIAYLKFIDPAITDQSSFFVGLGVSGIIDRVQDLATKKAS